MGNRLSFLGDRVVHRVEQIGRGAVVGLKAATDTKDTHGRADLQKVMSLSESLHGKGNNGPILSGLEGRCAHLLVRRWCHGVICAWGRD